jgi:cobyrinic acid a,c-diamide synthase
MRCRCPRLMIAATSSGCGKTTVTCGVLQALMDRGMRTASFKCGPDYIDPMFHSTVIGTRSKNLDTFFTGPDVTKYLFCRTASQCDISVIEGVMGFYDGLGGRSVASSSFELSNTLSAPVFLIVDCRGSATTVAAIVKGMKEFRENNIRGVILNRMSAGIYPSVKETIEAEVDVKVIGFIPELKDVVLESRHLGLVMPSEVAGLKIKMRELANIIEQHLDLDAMIALADNAPDLECTEPEHGGLEGKVKVAVARDEAFCFTYEDNLEALCSMGAEIIPFSPIHDKNVPDADGMILSGGYPELHGAELSANSSMLDSIRRSLEGGMPCIAECGGFMYLNRTIEDGNGTMRRGVGFLNGECRKTQKLVRFGYVSVTADNDQLLLPKNGSIKGHEFHYWDCTENGNSCTATKAQNGVSYQCIVASPTLYAGFPHLYYYSNLDVPLRFLKKCQQYKKERMQ